jgi:hypothetical protein
MMKERGDMIVVTWILKGEREEISIIPKIIVIPGAQTMIVMVEMQGIIKEFARQEEEGGKKLWKRGGAPNISENITETQVEMEIDTPEIARAARNSNFRIAPPCGFNPNPPAEYGNNDNINR